MGTNLVQADTTLTTVPVEETSDLVPAQTAALDALLSGKSATAAAAVAGIGRRTLYNWLKTDFHFQAALNRGRREMQQAVGYRVEQIAADAAECVAQAVRNGNVKAAMDILKGLKLLAPRKIGSEDELLLAIEQEERLEKRDSQIALAGLQHRKLLSLDE